MNNGLKELLVMAGLGWQSVPMCKTAVRTTGRYNIAVKSDNSGEVTCQAERICRN